jgi:hypothetical protein
MIRLMAIMRLTLGLLPGTTTFGVYTVLRVFLDPACLLGRRVALGDGYFRVDHVTCLLGRPPGRRWTLLSRGRISGENEAYAKRVLKEFSVLACRYS